MKKHQAPHVAVLVDTATGWGRRLIRGIIRYSEKHGPWHLAVQTMGQKDYYPLPSGWRGDGVIARIGSPRMVRELEASGIKAVNISAIEFAQNPFPCVTTDYNAVSALGFEHFHERGFRHFAYSGYERFSYGQVHRLAYLNVIESHGFSCHVHKPKRSASSKNKNHQLNDMMDWLKSLPKPVGVFTWGFDRGRELLEACREAEIAVPYEVAILGGDYDDLLCKTSMPPLSGVLVASEQIGYEAARLLERLMNGKVSPKKPILIPPSGVVEQRSTDTLAISDQDVVDVVRYIRENAFRPIQMSDILKAVPVSRRSIERKFAAILGRTPNDEIRRLRMAKAKHLLSETSMPMPEIADACGYGTYNYFTRVFKEENAITPREFRVRVQGR